MPLFRIASALVSMGMPAIFGHYVTIFLQLLFDVSRHGYVDTPVLIIPIQCDSAVHVTRPVLGKCIR